jgi:uncharacterized protein YndB with AHSA1/START domain
MSERKSTHGSFSIERVYDAAPERVFQAFADSKEKTKWFSGPKEWGPASHRIDFRVGGRETNRGGPKGGTVHAFEAHFWDIVPNRRIIFSYDMFLDATHISVSLATVEIEPKGTGTRLTFTEQGVYLDAYVDGGSREHGTGIGLDRLGESLKT